MAAQYKALSEDGFRVLALAIKELDRDDVIYNKDDEDLIPYADEKIGYDWVQGMPITNKNIT